MGNRWGLLRIFEVRKTGGALILLLLGGCANSIHLPSGTRVSSQNKAGTLEVGVTGRLSPWADISPTLKPNFSLTGDQARALVLPVTETINQQVLTALGAGLAVGLPTSGTTGSNTLTNSSQSSSALASGITTTTSTSSNGSTATTTTQKSPGTAPDLPTGIPAGAALPGAVGSAVSLGINPILQFRAASELFQEVQLLNQEIAMAATRDCYVPYVARIQLKVVNYRPLVPYSVHSKISFYPNGNLAVAGMATTDGGTDDPKDLNPRCTVFGDALPAVVPLLVSDDMQMAVKAKSAEASTQITAALSAMYAGIGARAQLNAVRQTLNAITNHVTSSSLTIGRSAENTIDAVISPTNLASGEPSLAEQPYYVSVLVLVPRAYFGGREHPAPVALRVRSFTQYRDARTGEILRSRDDHSLVRDASMVIDPYLTANGRKIWKAHADDAADELRVLMGATEGNTETRFRAAADSWKSIGTHDCGGPCLRTVQSGDHPATTDRLEDLRTTISSLNDDEQLKVSPVEAPLPSPITFHAQRVTINDDGIHPTQAVISNVDALSVAKLAATLVVTPLDVSSVPSVVRESVRIAPTGLALDTTGHTITLTFSSLKTLGITCLAGPTDPPPAKKGAKTGICPVRPPGSNSADRPNEIEFALIACDPGVELCPEIEDGYSQSAASTAENIDTERATLATALDELGAAVVAKDKTAEEALRTKVADDLATAREEAALSSTKSKTMEVSLVSAAEPTVPSPITLGKTGKTIIITNGLGSVTLIATGIPSGDTAGAVVSGAGIVSVVDQASQPLPFSKNGFVLPADGVYQFYLSNMTAGTAVHLAVTDYSTGAAKGGAVGADFTAVPAPPATKPSS